MGHCATCNSALKASQTICHRCGAPTGFSQRVPVSQRVPALEPIDMMDTQEEFQTLITQKTEIPAPKTLPMVPPPFTPPPQIVLQGVAKIKVPSIPHQEDGFEAGLGDFTEIADHIPEEAQELLSEDELDHTVDLEPEDFYSLDGETDFTPFPTAQLTSPPPRPKISVPAPPPPIHTERSLIHTERSPIPQIKAATHQASDSVSSLLILAHRSARVSLTIGEQAFGAQHDPTGGLLEELFPHHFSINRGIKGTYLKPIASHAELWKRVSKRMPLSVGDLIRIGHTKLVLVRSSEILHTLDQVHPHLSQAHTTMFSLLAFNSGGLLEGMYPIHEGVTRIGRAFADITLSDSALSISHVALLLDSGKVTLVDLGSESGIWSLVQQSVLLERNTVFSAGHTLFVAR